MRGADDAEEGGNETLSDHKEIVLRSITDAVLRAKWRRVREAGLAHGEDERRLVAVDAHGRLDVPEEMPKVDVHEQSVLAQQDVVVVAVGDAQHVGGDAVGGTGVHEGFKGTPKWQSH